MSYGHKWSISLPRKSLQLRLPIDLKNWIVAQAASNGSSQNSEITRSIRERMESSPSYNGSAQLGEAD
jgi:hypothetical protein